MARRLDGFLSRLTPLQLHSLCWVCIGLLGWIDYATGFEVSFSIFYLLPVSIAAWYCPGLSCYGYALASTCVWDFTNFLAGEEHLQAWVFVWNGFVRCGFFLISCSLIQRNRRALEREKTLSRRDFVTGLHNRRAFHEALAAEHSRSARKDRPIAVAMIDLDHFKQVNDEMGHEEGDRVLLEVARTLQLHLRKSDFIARLGGDEFAVILPECSMHDAEQVASKLVQCLRELGAREGWPVTASLGVVVQEHPRANDPLAMLLKASDEVMYAVKAQGRNSYKVQAQLPAPATPHPA